MQERSVLSCARAYVPCSALRVRAPRVRYSASFRSIRACERRIEIHRQSPYASAWFSHREGLLPIEVLDCGDPFPNKISSPFLEHSHPPWPGRISASPMLGKGVSFVLPLATCRADARTTHTTFSLVFTRVIIHEAPHACRRFACERKKRWSLLCPCVKLFGLTGGQAPRGCGRLAMVCAAALVSAGLS